MLASPESPTLDDFIPVQAYRSLGVGYLAMQGPANVQLSLSEEGAALADERPEVASLLTRMAHFIGEHDGYRDVIAVKEAEPGRIMHVGSQEPRHNGGYHYSSVYQPEAAPSVVVKAFDFDRRMAAPQFYIGGWMHDRIVTFGEEDQVYTPEQYAMFTSASGHRTTVMECVPGTSLWAATALMRGSYSYAEIAQTSDLLQQSAKEKFGKALGHTGLLFANDSKNMNNLMIEDPSALAPDTAEHQKVTLIDQPKNTRRARALWQLLRLGTSIRDRRQPGLQPLAKPA